MILTEEDAAIELVSICSDFKRIFDYCFIEDPTTEQVIKFIKHPHVMILADLFQKNKQVIVLKSKKVYVTTTVSIYALWKVLCSLCIEGGLVRCLVISSGQRQSKLVIDMCKAVIRGFPSWMNLTPTNESSEIITFKNNGYIYALPSTQKSGLGETASLVIIDEWDFHDYPEDDYATAKPTIAAGGQVIGISTTDKSKIDSLFKQKYREAKAKQNNFIPVFLPANILSDRTDEWFEKEKKDYIGLEHKWEENYPMTEEEALSPISVRSFFDKDVLKRLLNGCVEPIEKRDNGSVLVFSPWRPGVSYVAGADISQGIGGDAQCLVIAGKQGITSEVCAVIHTNNIAPDIFAYNVFNLCAEYKNPLLAVEANTIGQACINKLIELMYSNIFYSDPNKKRAGIFTSGEKKAKYNKEKMLVDLAVALKNAELITRWRTMIEEMYEFQWGENGRIESVGRHDDTVSAIMIANQLLKETYTTSNKPRVESVTTIIKQGMYAT